MTFHNYILLFGSNQSFSPLLICIAAYLLTAGLTVAILRHLYIRKRLVLEQQDDQQRIATALSEQRAMRQQNEALLEEIRERKSIEAKLTHAAFHDSVTGLHNRSYLIDRLESTLQRVHKRNALQAALIFIDLDNFNSVNDMFGHPVGDSVLVEFAERLRRCTREQDTLARIGGDEFTLILEASKGMEQVFRMARRILTLIEEPLSLAGTLLPITASVGICEIGSQYDQADDILRDADTAMYHAKREGGGRIVVYEPSMHEDAVQDMQAKLHIKAAVENKEFELYYQPLVDMRDCSIHGVEALIRWNHPTKGFIGPGEFIPLAEESGHIVAIGIWGMRQAWSDLQRLQECTTTKLLMSVNVSSRQLDESNFLAQLRTLLEQSGIPAQQLQLEITENVFLKDATRIGSLFKEIRSLGVKIAFDDFGTGYSSLSYLELYPIDTLKIDQSFVRRMKEGPVNANIIQFVINLAGATGMSVLAEGVETAEQASALMEYGCTLAQGYLYSKPVPLGIIKNIVKLGNCAL